MPDIIQEITAGFFDSVNQDRLYSADQMNMPYKKIVSDGLFFEGGDGGNIFKVSADSGMTVKVGPGNAMIGGKWAENAEDVSVVIAGNTGSATRIDSIILRLDSGIESRSVGIVYRQGATSAPALIETETIKEFRLGNISVAVNASTISDANIVDTRGTAECPWVTSVVTPNDEQLAEGVGTYLNDHPEALAPSIKQDVDDWLDEHPEVTTTVQDGSLTESKFADALKLKTIKDYVTPEMFGAKGDGVTDDSAAIIAAINTGHDVYGTKTYGIGSAIHALFEPSQNILINLKALSVMDYMLWIDAKGSAWTQLLYGSFDITADCAEKAVSGIRYDRCHGAKMTFNVMNCLGTGVTARYTSNLSCGGNTVTVDVNNVNTSIVPTSSIALRAGQDDHYPIVGGVDVNVCVVLEYGGNDFGTIHPWCSKSERVNAGAACIYVMTNAYNTFENITADTMKSVFKFSTSFLYPHFCVTGDLVIYSNTNVYTGKTYLVEIDSESAAANAIVFYSNKITDITLNTGFYASVEWYDGTIPSVLYTDGETSETTLAQARTFSFAKVKNKAFNRTEAVNISSLINADCCYAPISELTTGNYIIEARRVASSDYFEQKISSERGSAERRILRNGTVIPWANNSISTRTASKTIAISSGDTSVTIDTSTFLYLTPGSILYASVDFMNVPKPDGMIVNTASKNITITFPAEWSQLYNGDITVVITAVFNMPTLN